MESITGLLGAWGGQEPYLWYKLTAIIFGTAFITSAFGVGGGVFASPLIILFLPPRLGIGLLAPLMLLMSVTGIRQYWGHWNKRMVLVLLPSCICGIWLGTYLLAQVSPEAIKRSLGGLAIVFGILQLLILDRPQWSDRLRPPTWQGVGFGFGSGVTGALAHSGGIVFSFYLLPHSRTKEIFVGTTMLLFLFSNSVKLGTYWYFDVLSWPLLWVSLTLTPALFAGAMVGKLLNRGLSNKWFMRLLCILITLIGVRLLLA